MIHMPVAQAEAAVKKARPETGLHCGIIHVEGNNYNLVNRTRNIPFITKQKDPDFNFGCIAYYPGRRFHLQAQLTAPYDRESSPAHTSEIKFSSSAHNHRVNFRFDPVAFNELGYFLIRLDEGDLPGEYELLLSINQQPGRKVVFDVQKPQRLNQGKSSTSG